RAMRLDAPDALGGPARPLSLDPVSTAWALAVTAGVVALFWSSRELFATSGVRRAARATAWIGLAAAAVAIVQHATAPNYLYWHWRPEATSARPYGPFVSRNDLACWLVMAVPSTHGYPIPLVSSPGSPRGQI